jgi:hypothetical protein
MGTNKSEVKNVDLGIFYPENKHDEELIKKYIDALSNNDHTYKPQRISQILKK